MPQSIPPTLRIFPMTHKTQTFLTRTIQDVQTRLFLRDLPKKNGRFRYSSTGLNAPPNSLILFQYRAHIIASAAFLHDEKFPRPQHGYAGQFHLDPASIRTFDPLDAQTMRKIWPAFRAFGHVKQYLNPTLYPQFKRHLKHLVAPAL